MYRNKSVAVVVPAFNEQKRIDTVIKTMPDFVDHIVVVDDASRDRTAEVARATGSSRVVVIVLEKNQGVGGAIATGYRVGARSQDRSDGGDGRRRPDGPGRASRVLDPLVDDLADYSKGTRYFGGEAWEAMPAIRFFGNALLSLMTKSVSGYWHVSDVPSGYTACTLSKYSRRSRSTASIRATGCRFRFWCC